MRDFRAELRDAEIPELDSFLQQYLETRFSPSDRLSSELSLTLNRLLEFVSSVSTQRFDVAIRKPLGSLAIPMTATELVGNLADAFCRDVPGIASDLLKKSIEEALFISVDVNSEATVSQFGELFREFLARRGAVGLARLFVGLHMFNVIWLDLVQSDKISDFSEVRVARLQAALEQACFATADAAVSLEMIVSKNANAEGPLSTSKTKRSASSE